MCLALLRQASDWWAPPAEGGAHVSWTHQLIAARETWPRWLRAYDDLLSIVVAVLASVGVVAFGLLIVIVVAGVFFRYVLISPLTWAETVGLWSFVWVVFLGGPGPLMRGTHYTVELLVLQVPRSLQRAVAFLTLVPALVFCATVAQFGVWFTVQNLRQVDPALGQPYAISYGVIPICFGVMTAIILRDIVALIWCPERLSSQ